MAAQRVPLKDLLFNRDNVSRLASELAAARNDFAADRFVDEVCDRFPELELKQRIGWIADCLEAHLPSGFRRAVNVMLRSLPAPCDPSSTDGDFGDFIYAPYGELVARRGCTRKELEYSLRAIEQLTTRFSAEETVRPFINAFPTETLATLMAWTEHEHYHVRRLCSEGTRPKLPWAKKLTTPLGAAIPILDRLYYDHTRYVTRSVANHINDISKVDPDLAIDTLERWRDNQQQDAREMDFIARHATRTLTKRGHPGALRLLGVAVEASVTVTDFQVPERVSLGNSLDFSFALTTREPCDVIADYVIHFQGKTGGLTGRQVFKLKRLSLKPGERVVVSKRHLLRPDMTTRTLRPGRHELELQLNGQPQGRRPFLVST